MLYLISKLKIICLGSYPSFTYCYGRLNNFVRLFLNQTLLNLSMRPTAEDTMSALTPQQYCLRWKYHHSNLQAMFSQLLERESYCDVTLACEGKTLRAHKVLYSI